MYNKHFINTYSCNRRGRLMGRSFRAVAAVAAAKSPPHVLLLLADDLGHTDLGYTGAEAPTPSIDALAAAGVRLSNFYTWNWCAPSRGSLLTGVYAPRNGYALDASGGDSGSPKRSDGRAWRPLRCWPPPLRLFRASRCQSCQSVYRLFPTHHRYPEKRRCLEAQLGAELGGRWLPLCERR